MSGRSSSRAPELAEDAYDDSLTKAFGPGLPKVGVRASATVWNRLLAQLKVKGDSMDDICLVRDAVHEFLCDHIVEVNDAGLTPPLPLPSVKRALYLWYSRISVPRADKDGMAEEIAEHLQALRAASHSPPPVRPKPKASGIIPPPSEKEEDGAESVGDEEDARLAAIYERLTRPTEPQARPPQSKLEAEKEVKVEARKAPRRVFDNLPPDPDPLRVPDDVLFVCEQWHKYPKERIYRELGEFFLEGKPSRPRPSKDKERDRGFEVTTNVYYEISSFIKKTLPEVLQMVYATVGTPQHPRACLACDNILTELARKKVLVTQGREAAKRFVATTKALESGVPLWFKAIHMSGFQLASLSGAAGKHVEHRAEGDDNEE